MQYVYDNNSKNKCTYNPQMVSRKPRKQMKETKRSENIIEIRGKSCAFKQGEDFIPDKSYPENIVYFKTEHKNRLHPTQKPVALLEYLIKWLVILKVLSLIQNYLMSYIG